MHEQLHDDTNNEPVKRGPGLGYLLEVGQKRYWVEPQHEIGANDVPPGLLLMLLLCPVAHEQPFSSSSNRGVL